MTQQQALDELVKSLLAAHPTPDLAAQATQLVFGTGSPDADIMFIGEAPGKNEDQTGKPFVGAAGKFLDEMLASVELQRKDIYITNIVKYRPPNNRDPLPEEKKAMWPYLLKQIDIIKPKVVATLGRHSGQAFKTDLRISADHGQIMPMNVRFTDITNQEPVDMAFTLLPLYHPAAALYNGSLRTTLLEDFKKITEVI